MALKDTPGVVYGPPKLALSTNEGKHTGRFYICCTGFAALAGTEPRLLWYYLYPDGTWHKSVHMQNSEEYPAYFDSRKAALEAFRKASPMPAGDLRDETSLGSRFSTEG